MVCLKSFVIVTTMTTSRTTLAREAPRARVGRFASSLFSQVESHSMPLVMSPDEPSIYRQQVQFLQRRIHHPRSLPLLLKTHLRKLGGPQGYVSLKEAVPPPISSSHCVNLITPAEENRKTCFTGKINRMSHFLSKPEKLLFI